MIQSRLRSQAELHLMHYQQTDFIRIIRLSGKFTFETCDQFRDRIVSILDPSQKAYLLDLSQITHMDSSGIGSIVVFYKTASKHNSVVSIANLMTRAKHFFEIVNLDQIIPTFDELEDAKEYLQTKLEGQKD